MQTFDAMGRPTTTAPVSAPAPAFPSSGSPSSAGAAAGVAGPAAAWSPLPQVVYHIDDERPPLCLDTQVDVGSFELRLMLGCGVTGEALLVARRCYLQPACLPSLHALWFAMAWCVVRSSYAEALTAPVSFPLQAPPDRPTCVPTRWPRCSSPICTTACVASTRGTWTRKFLSRSAHATDFLNTSADFRFA